MIQSVMSSQRLTDLLLRVSWAQQGLEIALRVANDLHVLHRDEEQEEETESSPQSMEYAIVSEENSDSIVSSLVEFVKVTYSLVFHSMWTEDL